MRQLIDGARQLPLRHLSIRVPWNDSNWSGVVCARPGENNSCLVLPRISETRNDQFESQFANRIGLYTLSIIKSPSKGEK